MSRIKHLPIARYVDSSTVSVWMELEMRCAVVLSVTPFKAKKHKRTHGKEHVVYSVQMGDRHYAIAYVTKLDPDTLYAYSIETADISGDSPKRWPTTPDRVRCYKTYQKEDLSDYALGKGPMTRTLADPAKPKQLRLAVGSCLKTAGGYRNKQDKDVLAALGTWMAAQVAGVDDRLTQWPELLLLIGDQIYADDVAPGIFQIITAGRSNVTLPKGLDKMPPNNAGVAGIGDTQLIEFVEFADMHNASWANEDIKRVLANIPTFMIIDDHEVTDDLNLTGAWVRDMQADPAWPGAVRDGVIAYWIYQAWGNLAPSTSGSDPRVALMMDAAAAGDDALPGLRDLIDSTLYAKQADRLTWHYKIPSSPPILVLDARLDRELKAPGAVKGGKLNAWPTDRIVSEQQLKWLANSMKSVDEPVFVVSSVPVLMPSSMFMLELLAARTTTDPFDTFEPDTSLANWEDEVRRASDLEQWPAFPQSLIDFAAFLQTLEDRGQRHPLIVLSGDVHFSYVMAARFPLKANAISPMVFQVVSSPLRNQLADDDRDTVLGSKQGKVKFDAIPVGGVFDLSTIDFKNLDPNKGFEDLWNDTILPMWNAQNPGPKDPSFYDPAFTSVGSAPTGAKPWVEDNLLFVNNVCFVTVDKDRKQLEATWWTFDAADGLVEAAAYRGKLPSK